jgi:hypothetical protein
MNQLLEQGLVIESATGFALTPAAKIGVDQKVKQNQKAEEARFQNFGNVLDFMQAGPLTELQRATLWQVYNNYINECFLQYQSDAVKMLLPYSKTDENGADLIKQYASKLEDPICRSLFPNLIAAYPNQLSEADLNYISLIAERAERFYSLGLPEEEYKAATEFSVSNWVLIADTNVLYSILKLRDHAESEACLELTQLAKTGLVGFRIVYLPFTLKELRTRQYDLNGRLLDVKLTTNQIGALRRSGKLDPFMQPYFDQLATTGQAVAPAERIEKAQYILENDKIKIYNPQEIHNLQENGQYLARAYGEFYDFERFRNEARLEKGMNERTGKSQLQAEHDILLREVILALRDGKTSLAEIKQIGLTLDDALLRYDRYMIDKRRLPVSSAPTFFLPSLLLRRLRGFIPINTTDYRKAFFRAVSTKTFDPENKPLSTLVQRSVAYFNALGIDNPQIMMQMLSDEIFLSNLEKADSQGQGEEFTRSELDKRFGEMERHIDSLTREVGQIRDEQAQQLTEFKQQEEQRRAETEAVKRQAEEEKGLYEEEARKTELRHRELILSENQRLATEQQSLLNTQERVAKQNLLATLEPVLQASTLQNTKLENRAKRHLASTLATIGFLSLGAIVYYKTQLIGLKTWAEPIFFAFALPLAFFGLAYWVWRGKKFTDDQEGLKATILNGYRGWLDRRNAFNTEQHKALSQQVAQLRIELGIESPVTPKLLSTQA